jgi:ribose 5-phosphate isomerase RpiB
VGRKRAQGAAAPHHFFSIDRKGCTRVIEYIHANASGNISLAAMAKTAEVTPHQHDDMNVLVLGARIVGSALALEIMQSYLNARFQASEERFVRRLNKTKAIERLYMSLAMRS